MSGDLRDSVLGLLGAESAYLADGSWDQAAARRTVDLFIEQGWSGVGLAEERGGSGGAVTDCAEFASATAYSGSPSPVSDMVAITNPIADLLGIALPSDARLVIPVAWHKDEDPATARRVAWASWASHLLVIQSAPDGTSTVAIAAADGVRIEAANDVAGRPFDRVWCPAEGSSVDIDGDAAVLVETLGALVRSIQIAAALERVLELTVDYTAARRQFGRSLDRMPVVRHELAGLAGEAAAARAAASAAVETVSADLVAKRGSAVSLDPESRRAVAIAKIRTAGAATAGSRLGHQLHGALGVTREYSLHRFTTSMWAWRDEYGSECLWAERLGDDVRAGMWEVLTEGER